MPFMNALLGSKKTETTQSSSTSQQQQNSFGTTSQRRYLSEGQQSVMGDTQAMIQRLMQNPQEFVAPARTSTINSVNNNFANAGQMIRGKFMQGGGNRSGKAGRANREVEMNRLGQINDTNLGFDQKALDLQQLAAQLGLNFANINLGSDGTATSQVNSTGSTNSNSKTTVEQSPNILSSIQTLASLLTLGPWGMLLGGGKGTPNMGDGISIGGGINGG
jgi:hypothetical protein